MPTDSRISQPSSEKPLFEVDGFFNLHPPQLDKIQKEETVKCSALNKRIYCTPRPQARDHRGSEGRRGLRWMATWKWCLLDMAG